MKFTIITVCLNSAKTIRRTFDSLLEQSFEDYEYIVVDGESTDGTLEIIREYEPKFQGRMRCISEKDKGIYDAMNKGIRMAKGEYINIMNSDDWFEKDALKKIAEVPGNPDVIYGCIRLFFPESGAMDIQRIDHRRLIERPLFHQGCFIARKAHEKYGLYDLQYKVCADHDFLLKLYLSGLNFVAIDEIISVFSKGGFSEKNKWIYLKENFTLRYKNGVISKWAMIRGICSSRTLCLMEYLFLSAGKLFSSR